MMMDLFSLFMGYIDFCLGGCVVLIMWVYVVIGLCCMFVLGIVCVNWGWWELVMIVDKVSFVLGVGFGFLCLVVLF